MANILLMDNQPYMAEFISEGLREQGHQVIHAADPDCLILHLEEAAPDLLILDLNGLDGWDLLHEVKRFEWRIPVLVVTAFDSFMKDPRAGRADCCLIKDVALQALKKKIVEILGVAPQPADSK